MITCAEVREYVVAAVTDVVAVQAELSPVTPAARMMVMNDILERITSCYEESLRARLPPSTRNPAWFASWMCVHVWRDPSHPPPCALTLWVDPGHVMIASAGRDVRVSCTRISSTSRPPSPSVCRLRLQPTSLACSKRSCLSSRPRVSRTSVLLSTHNMTRAHLLIHLAVQRRPRCVRR